MSDTPASVPDSPARAAVYPRAAWCLGLILLAGCSGSNYLEHDPLVGGPPLRAPGSPAPGTGTAAAGAAAAGGGAGALPPLPATHSLTSQAALASGTAPAADSGKDLRINGAPTPGVPVSTWSGNAQAAGSGASLRGPEPVGGGPAARPGTTPAPAGSPYTLTSTVAPAPAAVGGGDTYLQLQEMLKSRGVTWQRLEPWGDGGEWKFRCSVPDPQNRAIHRNYEARAPGEYGLAAIRAVIQQIDAEKGRAPPPA
jgi:hypothetical protein